MKTSVFTKSALFVLAITTIILFMANAYYVWNWGDDYLIKFFYNKQTPMGYLINDYFVFDGRSLNPGYIISRLCLSGNWPYLAPMIASVLLYTSSIILVMMMNGTRHFKFRSDFVSSVVILAILWLAMFNSLNEILYWQTGMLYMVEMFLILYLYFLAQSDKSNKFLLAIIALLAGMSSPNAVIGLLIVLGLEQWFFKQQNMSLKNYYLVSVILIIGFLIVVLAPGSSARWNMQGGADAKAFGNVYELYFRIYQMTMAFLDLNTPMVWLVVFGGLAMVIGLSTHKQNNSFLWYLMEFRWLIAAVFCIIFYLPKMSYYIETSRLNCHFAFFCSIFFVTKLGQLKNLYPTVYINQNKILRFPILILALILMGSQVFDSIHCCKKLQAREQIYRDNQGKDVVLKANDIIGPPRTKFFTDVLEDSTHIFNISIADYYGLKSIRKEKYR